LPQNLRQDVGLKKDVVLTGMLDWIEIWDKDAWTRDNDTTGETFNDFGESLARLGIL